MRALILALGLCAAYPATAETLRCVSFMNGGKACATVFADRIAVTLLPTDGLGYRSSGGGLPGLDLSKYRASVQLASTSFGNGEPGDATQGSGRAIGRANSGVDRSGYSTSPTGLSKDAPTPQRFINGVNAIGCIGCWEVPVISRSGGNGAVAGSGAPSAGGVGRNSSNFGH